MITLIRALAGTAVGAVVSLGATAQTASLSYEFATLSGVTPSAVNNAGLIGGTTFSIEDTQAALGRAGSMGLLGGCPCDASAFGETEGRGLNDLGWLVGTYSYGRGAFLYRDGQMQDLSPTNMPSPDRNTANAIDDAGVVVGQARFQGASGSHAYVATDGHYLDLGTLGGAASDATAINNAGDVVGWSQDASGASHAFLYSGQTFTDLGTFGGRSAVAVDINDRGVIAGYRDVGLPGAPSWRSFLYDHGSIVELGALDGPSIKVSALNDRGDAVGSFDQGAFLYHDGELIALNGLIAPEQAALYVLTGASDINDDGTIVGSAAVGGGPRDAGFVLTPSIPEPSVVASMLVGLLALGGARLVRRRARSAPRP